VHDMHAATSKVENSAQGSSCKLKFVHGLADSFTRESDFALSQSMIEKSKKFVLTSELG
jgi:hypothetical protein